MSERALTVKDRMILANQYRILEKVDPDNAESYHRAVKILEQGYELDYESIDGLIDRNTVSVEKCREVYDILDMYLRLGDSYNKLGDKTGIEARDIQFPGFDGNNEGEYLSYGEFLHSQRKYEELPMRNSHLPSLDIYRRMLEAFQQFKNKPLAKADIQTIIAARIHPSQLK